MAKAPAFPEYAADYLADEIITLMTLEEEGALARAKAYCWREGSIPTDEIKLSRLLKNASNQTLRVVRELFVPCPNDASRMIYPKHEEARERQKIWKEKSAEAGKKSGEARRAKKLHAEPTFNQPSDLVEPKMNCSFPFASSSSIPKEEATSVASSAKPKDESRIVYTLPLNNGQDYAITELAITEWQSLYPAVDVPQECRSMKGWCISHPKKRKTKSGIATFINGWLADKQNRGGVRNGDINASDQGNKTGAVGRVHRSNNNWDGAKTERLRAGALGNPLPADAIILSASRIRS
jgi:hypothetical protein